LDFKTLFCEKLNAAFVPFIVSENIGAKTVPEITTPY
jgi:hypothetical protein